MIKRLQSREKYKAYSLIEMLITLILIGFLLTAVAVVLTTMIRASTMADSRTQARSESEFLLEVLELSISNSSADNVAIFQQSGRGLGPATQIIETGELKFEYIAPNTGGVGNEIHVMPTGGDRWTCMAYLIKPGVDEDHGFVMKTSASSTLIPPSSIDPLDHAKCFDVGQNNELFDYLVFFNSDDVSIEVDPNSEEEPAFGVSYYTGADDNTYFVMEITAKPVRWVAGERSLLKPYYHRTVYIRTRRLKL